MCGTDVPTLRRAIIEGTTMNVCGNCVKFGVEQAGAAREVTGRSRVTQSLERRAVRQGTRDIYASDAEELVQDYGARVRNARTQRGISIEDLGKKLNERRDILAKVESGSYHPEEGLIHKLEKEFGIKLKEKPEPVPGSGAGIPAKPGGEKALTLGDLIKQASEKKK
jgi:putative transcription factor